MLRLHTYTGIFQNGDFPFLFFKKTILSTPKRKIEGKRCYEHAKATGGDIFLTL